MKTLAIEPPIKPGTPDPYTPPKPGELHAEEQLQLGVITKYVTTLVRENGVSLEPEHGIEHQTG